MKRHEISVLLLVAVVAVAAIVARGGHQSRTGTATVTHVTDGDTVWLSKVGKVRLIGIDTPEVYGHVDCYGPQASAFTDRLLKPGTHVRHEIGRETQDVHDRTLAYLWLDDGLMVNELLAQDGNAKPLRLPP